MEKKRQIGVWLEAVHAGSNFVRLETAPTARHWDVWDQCTARKFQASLKF